MLQPSRAPPLAFRCFKGALVIVMLISIANRIAARSCLALSTTSTNQAMSTPAERVPFFAPKLSEGVLRNTPHHGRLALANLPTPLHRINPNHGRCGRGGTKKSILSRLWDLDINLYVKRDDMTGALETGGNKIRKLEFLLAEALAEEYDSVVTIGGEQSNHCRATASAARMLGLEPHLILRTRRANSVKPAGDDDLGYTGNILVDRLVGSTIYTCTPGEYGRVGSQDLVEHVCQHLKQTSQKKPYAIPVGGSNGLGSWGYINCVDELLSQLNGMRVDHVVFACGSGGTAAGITLGMALANNGNGTAPNVHAVGVCDSPDYFYLTVAHIADDMGLTLPGSMSTEEFVRKNLVAHQGKGLGYAASTPEELDFISEFAMETGIVLDPVYSGKAFYHFITEVLEEDPESYRGSNLLFWHTGGALGMFDKGDSLLGKLAEISPVKRLDVYGKGGDGAVSI